MSSEKKRKMDRRQFLGGVAAATAFTILPRRVLGGPGYQAPSDTLNIACVGVGGMGQNNVHEMATENIVALCDVDWNLTAPVFEKYPKAKRYKDYRAMLEQSPEIDAVIIATPDHSHAVITLAAMEMGKHVYTQKPLTHTVHEARLLAEAAAKNPKLVTQMGNQGHSGEEIRLECEWIQDGAIGAVREVHVWTDRPVWPQGIYDQPAEMQISAGLDWDLWIGPARFRPFNKIYHPFNWRGWWVFGTGALGDMGCHMIDHPYTALKLKYPTSVSASFAMDFKDDNVWEKRPLTETFPRASIVTYQFPERDGMPPVRLIWYDGGLQPPRPEELEPNRRMPINGQLYVGEKGKLLSGDGMTRLIPESAMRAYKVPPKTIPRIEGSHEQNFIRAIKEGKPSSAPFSYAGPLTETVLLGNIALKFPYQKLEFDPEAFIVRGNDEAAAMLKSNYRQGW